MSHLTDYFKNIGNDSAGSSKIQDPVKFNRMWEKINEPIWKLNNKGIDLEKSGKDDKAIIQYERCLQWIYDHFDNYYMNQIAWHSPNRLRVLYKKSNSPKELDFLVSFIEFCKNNNIEYPEIFDKQLSKLNKKAPDLEAFAE